MTIGIIAHNAFDYLRRTMKLRYILIPLSLVFLGFWWNDQLHQMEMKQIKSKIDNLQKELKECKTLLSLADGQLCKSSYYGDKHQGRRTASGATFDKNLPMCASWDYPLGTIIQVINLKNGKSAYSMVLDRGPDVPSDPLRKLDVSESTARELDMVGSGVTSVLVKVVSKAPLRGTIDINNIYFKKVRKAVSESWVCLKN
jgi:rare lipoprotein A